MKKNSFACTLAVQIYRASKGCKNGFSWADSMKLAWTMINGTAQNFTFVSFTKNNGTVTNRVVSEDLKTYWTPTGTGRPMKEGQVLFVDLGKYVVTGENFLISTYSNRIIRRESLRA